MAEDEPHSTPYKSAVNALDSILKNQNRSNTYKQAILLKDEITSKHLSINLKRVVYENENIRTFVSFKNTDSLSIKFYKIPRFINLAKDQIAKDTLVLNHIKRKKPFAETKVALPKTPDYYQATTEILLPKLEIGNYVAIVQEKNEPLKIENVYYNFIVVTNLVPSYFSTEEKEIFQVVNRKTGIPIKGIMVKVNGQTKETDAKGYAIFEKNLKKNKREAHFYNNLDSLTNTYSNYQNKMPYDARN